MARHAAVRTGIAFALQLISGGLWAMLDPTFVAHNAIWFVVAGVVICVIVWLWDEIRRFAAWKRRDAGGSQLSSGPSPNTHHAHGIVYGPTSRGGTDEDSRFVGFGDGDIPIHDQGEGNKHVRPTIFRKPAENK